MTVSSASAPIYNKLINLKPDDKPTRAQPAHSKYPMQQHSQSTLTSSASTMPSLVSSSPSPSTISSTTTPRLSPPSTPRTQSSTQMTPSTSAAPTTSSMPWISQKSRIASSSSPTSIPKPAAWRLSCPWCSSPIRPRSSKPGLGDWGRWRLRMGRRTSHRGRTAGKSRSSRVAVSWVLCRNLACTRMGLGNRRLPSVWIAFSNLWTPSSTSRMERSPKYMTSSVAYNLVKMVLRRSI